jgi:uncharacterized protein YeeX (DUF496 family)
LVKWKNYDDSQNTWEPIGNLQGCINKVLEFENSYNKNNNNHRNENDNNDDIDTHNKPAVLLLVPFIYSIFKL